MIKVNNLELISQDDIIMSNIWEMLLIIKSENFLNGDYHVLLFLISVYKDDLITLDLSNKNQNLKEVLIKDLYNSENDLKIQYSQIYKSFIPTIEELSEEVLWMLLDILANINKNNLKVNFPFVFDSVLNRITDFQGRNSDDHIIPQKLSQLMIDLAHLDKDATVYNPFAGLASFGLLLDNKQSYFGQEINQKTWATGVLRLMAYNKFNESSYLCQDSIENWNLHCKKYDLIISTPPFGLKVNVLFEPTGIKTIEHFLIENGINSLKLDGKLVALLPESFLYKGINEEYRKFLVDADLIETIVSLPGGLLKNTGISLVILLINKAKKEKGVIKLIKTEKFRIFKSVREKTIDYIALSGLINGKQIDEESFRTINIEKIANNDYNLSVSRYFRKEIEGVKLGKILQLNRGDRRNLQKFGKWLKIKDLKDDRLDYNIDISNIDELELKLPLVEKITESCLLISSRTNNLRPSFFEYNGEEIFKFIDIFSFKVDETIVDIGYLINELHSDYVREQIESFRIGTAMPVLRMDDFMEVVIKLPTLAEQKAKVRGIMEAQAEQKKNDLLLFQKIHGLESEIYEQNNFLRHAISGNLANLRSSFKRVKSIFDNQIQKSYPDLMLIKENVKSDLTLEKLLIMMDRDIEKISLDAQRNSLGDDSLKNVVMESIEIFSFLNDYVNEVKADVNRIFEITFKKYEEDFVDNEGNQLIVYINGNKDLLKDMLNNLIENAVVHAFESSYRKDNLIDILLMGNFLDTPSIYISVMNNGKRLPENFDHNMFTRKGSKAGENAGNGFGGWYINQIIEKHNGNLIIDDEQGPEGIGGIWSTSFEIEIPILNYESNETI